MNDVTCINGLQTSTTWTRSPRLLRHMILWLLLGLFAGCAAVAKRHPPPEALFESVYVVDMPDNIRAWGDRHSDVLRRTILESVVQAKLAYGAGVPGDVLAISGGGSYGAYAAGVLCGWTAAGTRPTFRMVSGVSVGAIIAPFAFLGSEYDAHLEEMARAATADNTYRMRWWTQALTGDSVADNAPLVKFISHYYGENVLRAVGAEHLKGRRLFVATTNLDANRPVVWDLGAIAASGSPRALELFRDVIVASAAVPVFFPPIYIDVECAGNHYDEMHVDGGVTAQVLLYGNALTIHDIVGTNTSRPTWSTYYIIRNGKFSTKWEPVRPTVRDIASRSISRIIQAQGVGDLWQAYAACRRDGLEFRLASIPDEALLPAEPGFGASVVAELFERGYMLARDGNPWSTEPPGLRANSN